MNPLLQMSNFCTSQDTCKGIFPFRAVCGNLENQLHTEEKVTATMSSASWQLWNILRLSMLGVASHYSEWDPSQLYSKLLLWMRNGIKLSSEINFSQQSRSNLVIRAFSIVMEHNATRRKWKQSDFWSRSQETPRILIPLRARDQSSTGKCASRKLQIMISSGH